MEICSHGSNILLWYEGSFRGCRGGASGECKQIAIVTEAVAKGNHQLHISNAPRSVSRGGSFMIRRFFAALLLAATFLFTTSVASYSQTTFDSVVSFGDSLSDNGNIDLASGGAAPGAAYFDGRFSNGPVQTPDLILRSAATRVLSYDYSG